MRFFFDRSVIAFLLYPEVFCIVLCIRVVVGRRWVGSFVETNLEVLPRQTFQKILAKDSVNNSDSQIRLSTLIPEQPASHLGARLETTLRFRAGVIGTATYSKGGRPFAIP